MWGMVTEMGSIHVGRQPGTECQSQSRQQTSIWKGDSGSYGRLVTYVEIEQISKNTEENMGEEGYKYGNEDINTEREKTNMSPVGLDWNWRYWCELMVFHVNM